MQQECLNLAVEGLRGAPGSVFPAADNDTSGAVPDRSRGSEHMAPTCLLQVTREVSQRPSGSSTGWSGTIVEKVILMLFGAHDRDTYRY